MQVTTAISIDTLLAAYERMCWVRYMAQTYDENRDVAKYVHSTSRGHEAVQLALAMQLKPQDFVYPYYRDESILLGIGMKPYDLMLQLLAKRNDPFSGGRTYYAHPSLREANLPKIPHQSSATGMQAIPATGAAHGIAYLEQQGLRNYEDVDDAPVVVCSLGDGAMTEGEVSEALQMAVLHKMPIMYLVQDNDWGISASGDEMRAMTALEFAKGFKGLEAYEVDGSDFSACYEVFHMLLNHMRVSRKPVLVYAKVPLLGHHTSGVRREWYREAGELSEHQSRDPFLHLENHLLEIGVSDEQLEMIQEKAKEQVAYDFARAKEAPDPTEDDIYTHIFAPTPVTEELGERSPANGQEVVMVDAALHAMEEILREHPESLLYGQDVGHRLGGVFREAATLAGKFGRDRIFNTPIQEAYIIGSTAGMSAVGCKPVVEVQFADYIWPGLNQLFTELSRSCYLSNGKWPVQSLIRVPIGAYNGGGPYHSSSVESVLLNIRGVKVAYPSTAADMKGLFKAAFYDPNPVVLLEHKGLYWSKVAGTKEARGIEPDSDYILPLGKARTVRTASEEALRNGETCLVVTYGMGVYWAINSAPCLAGQVEVLDLRTLEPLDWEAIEAATLRHGKVLVVTEEPELNTFAEALAGRIGRRCFRHLDAPVQIIGSAFIPAIGLSHVLENATLPNAERVGKAIEELIGW
jgi:2-oxoisovalerate dehydrogenase E1 component